MFKGSPEIIPQSMEKEKVYFEKMKNQWKEFWQTLIDSQKESNQDFNDPELDLDFSNISSFEEHAGYIPIIIPRSNKPIAQFLFDNCAQRFGCWKEAQESLNEVINDRDSQSGSYVVWFLDRPESDNELRCMSGNDIKNEQLTGITLPERLAMELEFFERTGRHKDVGSVTSCQGSHYPKVDPEDNNETEMIPDVFFNIKGGIGGDDFEEMRILKCSPDKIDQRLATRIPVEKFPNKNHLKLKYMFSK